MRGVGEAGGGEIQGEWEVGEIIQKVVFRVGTTKAKVVMMSRRQSGYREGWGGFAEVVLGCGMRGVSRQDLEDGETHCFVRWVLRSCCGASDCVFRD